MSFNRLNYDNCSYKQVLRESVGPGEYHLGTPPVSCDPCFAPDPRLRLQRSGVSVDPTKTMIDVDSDLMNIVRKSSNCPSKKFIPDESKKGKCEGLPKNHFKKCDMPTTEDTRVTNPSSNLRGTGWNRWEWLCQDPQERVMMPFDNNINVKLLAKDNHRPCIPKPLDQNIGLPDENSKMQPEEQIQKTPSVPTEPSSVQWQRQSVVQKY